MMPRLATTIALLALSALAGCGGKPTTYLSLPDAPPGQRFNAAGAPVAVSPVQIPPSLDRTQLTTQTGAATLHVAGDTRWSGPLSGLTQDALARDLATLLPRVRVLMPGDPVPQGGVRQVQVNIQHFMPDSSGQVTLDADWTVMAPDGQTVLAQNRFHGAVQGEAEPGADAQSMGTVLGQLAAAIAQALAQDSPS